MSKLPDNAFRANVGAMIINEAGYVLALERAKLPDAWQLPQGGLEQGEEPEAAVYRELLEETGIQQRDVALLAVYPEWLAYELEKSLRRPKLGRGQVQKWFLFQLQIADAQLDLSKATGKPEFSQWRWMKLQDLIAQTVAFKQPVYEKLAHGFAEYLA